MLASGRLSCREPRPTVQLGAKKGGTSQGPCRFICEVRARGLGPCARDRSGVASSFFLKNEEARANVACDSVDCRDAWLKLEPPLAFFAVAGSPELSAFRFWRLRVGGFPSSSILVQLPPVAAKLELTAEERLPRRDASTLTVISFRASSSSMGPRDEGAKSPQAVLPLRDFPAPGPAGLTNCVPAPLSISAPE